MPLPTAAFRRPAASTIISVTALVFAMGGFAVASIPGPGGVITTCYLKSTGVMRVIDSKKKCTKREKTLSLNQQGVRGDTGAQGTPGSQGPPGSDAQFNGATAGGDLTGTYPNPTLGTGKVTSSNIFDGTITPVDIASANIDGAAGTPSLRTLGTGAAQAAAGNDSRFTGPAGGDLTGNYPGPTIGANTVTGSKLSPGTASASVNFASMTASCNEQPVGLTGALTGDAVFVGPPPSGWTPGIQVVGYVSTPGVVSLRACAVAGPIDPPSETYRVVAIHP